MSQTEGWEEKEQEEMGWKKDKAKGNHTQMRTQRRGQAPAHSHPLSTTPPSTLATGRNKLMVGQGVQQPGAGTGGRDAAPH